MKTKKLSNKEKFAIVLEGLKGVAVADICASYGISQGCYYKLRDKFLSNAENVFDLGKATKNEQRLVAENIRLKQCVADLTLEIKKMKVDKVRGIYKVCEERNRQVVKLVTRLKSEHSY